MMTSVRAWAAALFSVWLVACGGAEPWQPVNMSMSRIQAWWPYVDAKQSYAIRNEADWQRVWLAHEPQTWPTTERPLIDFTKDMVLGLTLGTGSSGCYGMSIRRVIEEERELRVEYLSATPSGLGLCTMSIVPLTDFVVVPRSDKSVYFVQVGT